MSPLHFLQIALPTPLRQVFDYLDPNPNKVLLPGIRVKVPFQRRELIGILQGVTNRTDVPLDKLKPIIEVLDLEPILSKELLELCQWAADYYHYSLGEVYSAALPALLRKGKPLELKEKKRAAKTLVNPAPLVLNNEQQTAVTAITHAKNTYQTFLLDGVTGSGKTEVYLQAIEKFLANEKQILVLVPEIGLTPQTIQRFTERFNVPVVALHSGLTERERLNAWLNAKNNTAKIVIGTRSAVFTPFENLGLIIVDEEHDLSFKQQEGFRYHARDIAIMRAHFNNIPIVLGSATPSLESLHNATQNRYHTLRLQERAGGAKLPGFEVLDIRKKDLDEGLSPVLLARMKEHLDRGEQVMLFLNRRGFSPVLMCHGCGWIAECKRCDSRMTYHHFSKRLHCHKCNAERPVFKECQHCKATELHPVGLGTERLEAAIEKYFPNFSIARLDRDTTQRKGSMETLLNDIHSGQHSILIGTQMLAKGHHFPNVTLVAIVDVDGGFFSTDFRALERTGQLILQVAGRAGRMEKLGTVIIQTRQPEHPLLHILLKEGYSSFAKMILQEREEALLPPYSFFALFRAEAHQLTKAMEFLQSLKNQNPASALQLSGPYPAPMAKRAGYHRCHLILQSNQRKSLREFLQKVLSTMEKNSGKQKVRWSLDVDPVELI